jgi:hypothetical protein
MHEYKQPEIGAEKMAFSKYRPFRAVISLEQVKISSTPKSGYKSD